MKRYDVNLAEEEMAGHHSGLVSHCDPVVVRGHVVSVDSAQVYRLVYRADVRQTS